MTKREDEAREAREAQRAARGIVEVSEWNEWKVGDRVGRKNRKGTYLILSFRVTPDFTVCKWVNVVGGMSGEKELRSFLPETLVRRK